MKTVMAHNIKYEQGIESYMMEMNMFADLTTEEFAEKYLLKNLPFMNTGKCGGSVPDATVK